MKEPSLLRLLFLLSLVSPIFSLFKSSYPILNTGYSTDDDTVINVFPDPVNPGGYGTPPPHWPERPEGLPSIEHLPIPFPSDEGSVGGSYGFGAPLLPWDAEGAGDNYVNGIRGAIAPNAVGLDDYFGPPYIPEGVDSIPAFGPEIFDRYYGDAGRYVFGGNVPGYGSVGGLGYGALPWDAAPSSEVDLEPRNPGGNIGYGAPPPPWEGDDVSSGAGEDQSSRGYGSGGYGAVPAPSEPWDGDVFGGTVVGGPGTGPEYGGFEVEQPVDLPGELEVPEQPMEPLPGDGGYKPGLGFGGSEVGTDHANPMGPEEGYELPVPSPASDEDPILIQVFPDTVPSRGYGVPPLPQGTEEADGEGSIGGYGNGGYGTGPLDVEGDGSGPILPGDNEEPAPVPSPIGWPFVNTREEEKIPVSVDEGIVNPCAKYGEDCGAASQGWPIDPPTDVEVEPVNPIGIEEGGNEDGSGFPELCDPHGNWDCILYRR